jgi:o-succinylbenzoate synthase
MNAEMSMRTRHEVDSPVIQVLDLPLKRTLKVGNIELENRRLLMLRLKFNDACGVGEAAPLEGYSPETIDEAKQALQECAHDLASKLDELVADPKPFLENIDVPSVRFAVETALIDLRRQLKNQTHLQAWMDYLGFKEETSRQIEISALLPKPAIENARALRAQGFHTLKLKVRPGDHEKVQELMAQLPDTRIRLDANQSLSIEEALTYQDLAIEFFEEPVATRNLPALAKSTLAIYLDESLQTHEGQELLELPCVKGIILKPTTLGGLSPSARLAEQARAQGQGVVVTHCFEGFTAYRAICILAAMVSTKANGLTPHPCLEACFDSVAKPPMAAQASLNLESLEQT